MYTVLDENLQVKGRLTLNNGQGSTAFFSDTITQQMATDNSNDPAQITSIAFNELDKQGNAKQWNHTLTIAVESTDLGTGITTKDYLMYFDSVANHYYLMKVLNSSTDRGSGFITVTGINAAIYELGKLLVTADTTFKNATVQDIISKAYKNAPFSLQIADDLVFSMDYTIPANTSLQATLQDIQAKYNCDVDSWVEVDPQGGITDRVLYFGHLGQDNGELIRYGGSKGLENINAQEVSDIIYTKLYISGVTNDKDATKGHIGSINNGMEYIVDDNANQLQNAIGASQMIPSYLEGSITNTVLSEPLALLDWGKAQMALFNHPRFNYTVTPLHDEVVSLGDTISVQDFHVKPMILVTSKVIQKTTSFASPETNSFVLGEFTNIFTDSINKGAQTLTLMKKDVTVVQEAADYARAAADAAHQQAVAAQEAAIHAQTSADGKTTTYTADSFEDLPKNANEGDLGWVNLSDGRHGYSYINGKWVEIIDPAMGADIDKKVSDVVNQAKDYSDKAIADNQVKVDASIKSVDDKANELKQKLSAFDDEAQGYADKAKADAIADANQSIKASSENAAANLAQAKIDITNAYQSADGTINKKIDDTVSSITSTISQNKKDADGNISTAQSTAQQALDGLKTKVSQSDYDTKTGDLSTKVSTAQQTADQAGVTIGNYQKSNDGRIASAESNIKANAEAITQKVSQTDYNQKTGELSGKISEFNQTADKISQTVSDVKTQVDGLSVGGRNLLIGTSSSEQSYTGDFSTVPGWANNTSLAPIIAVNVGSTYTYSINLTKLTGSFVLGYWAYDSNKNYTKWVCSDIFSSSGKVSWTFTIPSGISYITPHVVHASDDFTCTAKEEKLEVGNLPTDWTPAPEDTDTKISTVSQKVDSITSIVSDPTTGLTKRIQTAEGTLSQVTGADIPALQKATYWQPYSSLDFNSYTNQGSFFFNTTETKINSPVSGNNSWIYLMVEQGISDNSRIKQTAWYDGVTGVKITYVRTLNSGTWSPWYANDNDSVTTITQTNEAIRTEISNRQTGDSNTLTQAKDFTSSQVSNSESNMRSLINQKADSATIGVIQNDVATLKSNTQWQRVERFDDMNYMMTTGRFFVGASAGTNSAVSASFYIAVDAPQTDRITQTQWKDLDGSLMYRRTYNGSSWTPWTQMVMSSTLLNIFHDSWSLGTTTNDGITKQMVTGIMGQPDGTLILKGNSLILDGNTTVTGDFYAKGGNFQNLNASNIKVGTLDGYQVNIANVNVNNLVGDTISGFNFNVNKQMTIASGGIIKSDVVNMGSNSFYVNSSNIDSTRTSSESYKVATFRGTFNISSSQGSVSSSGDISVYNSGQSQPYKNGHYGSEYNGNNILLYATGYDNSDPNEFLNISSAQIDISHSSDGLLSNATDKTRIRSNLIETTGTLNAFGVTQTPRVYSWPNLTLESIQQSVVMKAGNQNILQVRENGYVYLLTRHSGSGGVSVQMAGDGAFFMQSSATKYKEDIQYDGGTSVGDKFLTLDPATWQDKDEYEQRKLYRETGIEPTHQIHMTDKRYYGLIAEDLVKAGLEEFVVRDEVTGEVNGLEYDKVAISLIPVVREQRDAINELRLEVERLKQK